MNLGYKIRELRKQKHLTQEQLAATLNITSQAVSKWEMGASYPDMTMIPVLAGLFGVSLDELFDFNVKDVDREIEEIIREHKNYYWSSFEKAEKILLDGLERYPASVRLKTELLQLYANRSDRGEEMLKRAYELYGQILGASQDVFCTCRSKENMVILLRYREREGGESHREEIEKIIESLPCIYPYMIPDKMRLCAEYLPGEKGRRAAVELKIIQWQEFFIACAEVGRNRFEAGDYEQALEAFRESVDVIERFMDPGKQGFDAYPIGGTHANHATALLSIAACRFRLGKTDGIDALLSRAEHIYFDAFEHTKLRDYAATMGEMISYYTDEYNRRGLSACRPLDLTVYERRIGTYKKASAD